MTEKYEMILEEAIKYNAIVLTKDNNMKARVQAKRIFTLFVR